MIETLQKLCQTLSAAPLTVQTVAAGLGVLLEDKGGDLPLLVRPFDPAFKKASVVRRTGSEEPAHVNLTPAGPGTLSVPALSAAFGDYTEPPKLHWDSPLKLIFYPALPTSPYTCAIIAEVEPGEQGVTDGIVTTVTIRRDIRLE